MAEEDDGPPPLEDMTAQLTLRQQLLGKQNPPVSPHCLSLPNIHREERKKKNAMDVCSLRSFFFFWLPSAHITNRDLVGLV